MAIGSFKQDPTARLDYAINWSDYLEPGDSVLSATARIDPTATGIDTEDPVIVQDNVTIVWVATTGAAAGKYTGTVHIVTAAGREDERSITIAVQDQ